jgi:hypothetical protein
MTAHIRLQRAWQRLGLGALITLAAAAGALPPAGAQEYRGRGAHEVPGHEFRDHEFREHEFRDPRFHDMRYHHDHYYPPRGFVFGALPPGYLAVHHGGLEFFFGAGVWYRPYAPGRFVVVAPPIGVFVPVLPPYYTTIWVSGVPYYYANDVYYVHAPGGYTVAPPPPAGAVVQQGPSSASPPYIEQPQGQAQAQPPAVGTGGSSQVFAYPQRGQSADQQARDRYECHSWAAGQSGYDPSQPPPGALASQADDYRRAMTACLETRGYTVR